MLCKSGSSSYTEHKKIGFANFGFFYDFISNLQGTSVNTKIWYRKEPDLWTQFDEKKFV
jgi:hypothetical protein